MEPVLVAVTSGILAALVTGVAQFLAAVVPARRSAAAARAASLVAQHHGEREWLIKVDAMCRSDDPAERRVGLRFLRATMQEAPGSPMGRALLDELTREHFGRTLEEARHDLSTEDQLILLPPEDDEAARRRSEHGPQDPEGDA